MANLRGKDSSSHVVGVSNRVSCTQTVVGCSLPGPSQTPNICPSLELSWSGGRGGGLCLSESSDSDFVKPWVNNSLLNYYHCAERRPWMF